jgi:hypothetical protein
MKNLWHKGPANGGKIEWTECDVIIAVKTKLGFDFELVSISADEDSIYMLDLYGNVSEHHYMDIYWFCYLKDLVKTLPVSNDKTCFLCNDTGTRAESVKDTYTMVFCQCNIGKKMAKEQSDTIADYC